MVSKIKIKVKTYEVNLNLPSIPISLLNFGVKVAAKIMIVKYKHNLKIKDKEIDVDDIVSEFEEEGVLDLLDKVSIFLKEAKPYLKKIEPFTLVEVQTQNEYVLVEVL